MIKILSFVLLFGLISGLPLGLDGEGHDFLSDTGVELKHLANVLMSPHILIVCNESVGHGLDDMKEQVQHIKEGALGMAAKGVLVAKKGAYVAGRIILKPIAIVTGLHLKMLGAGLAGAGKVVLGTGAGIAKAGTVVKYAGLGSIGLGASAIGWGLDKTTIDSHFKGSQQTLHTSDTTITAIPVIHTFHQIKDYAKD